MFHVPEKYRIEGNLYGNTGNNGCFLYHQLRIIASEGDGWEHVSVSLVNRIPYWSHMCTVKNMFWDKEDCVIQYHPPESDYVRNHPHVLHLWRPIGILLPMPPILLV